LTLTQLKYLISVCECGTFAAAAEQLHVSQPTLSAQIKKLELSAGYALLDRSRSPLSPSPEGIEYVKQARAVMQEVARLESLREHESPDVSGVVSIGVIPTVAHYMYLPLLQGLKCEYPKLTVSIHELPTNVLIERLEAGNLDMALVAGPLTHHRLQETLLYFEPFVVLANASQALQAQNIEMSRLQDLDLLMLGEEHCLRDQTLKLCQRQPSPKPAKSMFECASVATIQALVRADIAAALLPALCIDDIQSQSQYRNQSQSGIVQADVPCVLQFSDPVPARAIGLVAHKNYFKFRTLEAVRQIVLAQVPKSYLQVEDFHVVGIDHG